MYLNLQSAALILYFIAFSNFHSLQFLQILKIIITIIINHHRHHHHHQEGRNTAVQQMRACKMTCLI